MVEKRTSRGQIIDFDKLRSTADATRPAIGNMGTDGKGNKLGKAGKIVQSNEERVRKYYAESQTVSQDKVSLKTDNVPAGDNVSGGIAPEVKTAKTEAENVRTAPTPSPTPAPTPEPTPEPTAPEGEVFDTEEPLGYKEVELPNGDIEMVPYYREEDAGDQTN